MSNRGGFRRKLGTDEFARDCLKEHSPTYVQEMWRAFKRWCMGFRHDSASYESFRSYLKELGLIEKDREEKSSFGENKIYYRLPAVGE